MSAARALVRSDIAPRTGRPWTFEWVYPNGTRLSHETVLRMLAAQKQARPRRRDRSIRP